jgi:Xaa-Pro aminopeptidase
VGERCAGGGARNPNEPKKSAQINLLAFRCAVTGVQSGAGGENPIISRLVSLDHPMEIRTGMVFALETYCPATDGFSAARIEEEVVVTDTGGKVITNFPAEELPIANAYRS